MSKTHIQLELERAPLEVLLRYVEGKLSSPERKTVETLVADSPVYTDALEGLQSMENPAMARSMSNDLRFRTRNLLRRRAKPRVATQNFNQYLTAAVAVIVVLFGAASVVYFYSRNDVEPATIAAAEKQDNASEVATEEDSKRLRPFRRTTPAEYDGPSLTEDIIADASPASEDDYSLVDEASRNTNTRVDAKPSAPTGRTSKTEVPPVKVAEPETVYIALNNEPTLSEERQAEFDNAKPRDEVDSIADASEEAVALNDVVVTKETDATMPGSVAPALAEVEEKSRNQTNDIVDPAEAYKERQKRKTKLMREGEMLFNTSRYNDAEKTFLELYTLDQLDPKTQYYLGSTYFYLGRPAEATIYLEQVVRVSSDFLEEAQWSLVDAYLAVNKLSEAKKLLKKVSKQNTKYSDRAQAKLKELK